MQLILDLQDDSNFTVVLAAIKRLVTSDGIRLTLRSPERGMIFDPANGFDAETIAAIEDVIAEKESDRLPSREQIESDWQNLSAEIARNAKQQGIETDEDVNQIIRGYRQEKRAKAIA